MAWLFYKGEFQREVISPVMTKDGINGTIPAAWPQEWGRDAIVVSEHESGYFMHWVAVGYYYHKKELHHISLYPTFEPHKWREVIDLWFLLKP